MTADGVTQTTNDSTLDTYFAEFLNFGAGVLSLVLLSCSVIWGLVAQDRVVLDARRRIMAQAVHRTTAVASIVFLLVHIGVKVALEHTTWVAAVVPFGLLATESETFASREVLIGFGTSASLLMIFVGVTGVLRNRFAAPAVVASRWRALHMLAYPAWCLALLHGLYAGRPAKPIFTILYGLCVVGVMAALALRAAPRPVKRKVADALGGLVGGEGGPAREALMESRERTASGGDSADDRRVPGGAENSWAASPPPSAVPNGAPRGRSADGFAASYQANARTGAGSGVGPSTDARGTLPMDALPTETMRRIDGPGSTSGNWPAPSPPPVGEAPPSAYDPLEDTAHSGIPRYDPMTDTGQAVPVYTPSPDTSQGIPVYTPTTDTSQGIPVYNAMTDTSQGIPVYNAMTDTGQGIPAQGAGGGQGYGASDVGDTRETNAAYATYYPNDTYNSGPATASTPGAHHDYSVDAPGSGESWNTPSGGMK
ncbi:cytochrome b/b6 domain-containing protein [Streptomyces sp. WMMC905]|uniref:cytochrome b/b6 domain-containing protein n=1 Tax=Streptomyces sp. WMMC905 TaxID=3404123 RepID=UPI003B95959C